jgi:hypothetical protein
MRTMGDLEVREEKYSAEIKADLSLQGEAIFLYFYYA